MTVPMIHNILEKLPTALPAECFETPKHRKQRNRRRNRIRPSSRHRKRRRNPNSHPRNNLLPKRIRTPRNYVRPM